MDSIGMKGNIVDVEADASHVLVDHNTFLGGPLESGFHRILDLLQVLHLLGNINKHVRASGLRTEAPDFLGIIGIPLEIVLELAGSFSHVLFRGNFVIFNCKRQFITERSSLTVNSVMLVG